MKYAILTALMVLFGATLAEAQVIGQTVEYEHDGTVCEGYFAYSDSFDGPRPGVLVVHQWKGLGEFEIEICRRLAELGYCAFAADVYGKGVRPQTRDEAGAQAGIYRGDRELMRARVAAGLDALKAQDLVDAGQTAAIGYCFGGGCVLELARSGADVSGVVSFHGNLDTPDPGDAANITASVLVLHGADDPGIPPAQVTAFWDEMRDGEVADWQFVAYGNAVHAFTDYRLPSDNSAGAAYNEAAARRSWQAMLEFFTELFAE